MLDMLYMTIYALQIPRASSFVEQRLLEHLPWASSVMTQTHRHIVNAWTCNCKNHMNAHNYYAKQCDEMRWDAMRCTVRGECTLYFNRCGWISALVSVVMLSLCTAVSAATAVDWLCVEAVLLQLLVEEVAMVVDGLVCCARDASSRNCWMTVSLIPWHIWQKGVNYLLRLQREWHYLHRHLMPQRSFRHTSFEHDLRTTKSIMMFHCIQYVFMAVPHISYFQSLEMVFSLASLHMHSSVTHCSHWSVLLLMLMMMMTVIIMLLTVAMWLRLLWWTLLAHALSAVCSWEKMTVVASASLADCQWQTLRLSAKCTVGTQWDE